MMATARSHHKADLRESLRQIVVGQDEALDQIACYIELSQAALMPQGRPAGIFLLLGPTGTGKTKTVEAVAEVLHRGEKKLLRVDCGEFSMEHEVAKLIGAPPGYLGHRETQPLLTQNKLNAAVSQFSDLAVVLFDEIEKAAPSMVRLLLGVLDKATLRLGDNSVVNFEKTLIFLTSNLGARAINQELRPTLGFEALLVRQPRVAKIDAIGLHAVRRKFPPEFVNRIDVTLTYHPLTAADLDRILSRELQVVQEQIYSTRGDAAFVLSTNKAARAFLLEHGTSAEYGARELKRTIQRHLLLPLAQKLNAREIPAGSTVRVTVHEDSLRLRAAH